MTRRIEETLHPGMAAAFEAEEVLYEGCSGEQSLCLIRNAIFGRMLFLDEVTQVTEADEFIYHEMLAHLPILAHGAAHRVLIIGGGDGGMAEEVLKHRSVERVTMVEIDPSVVEFSRRHLGSISKGAFDDPRLELVFADGARFAAEAEQRFDVAIIDSTDPIGPGEALFTEAFYSDCRRLLAPGGILVTQNGVPFLQPEELRQTMAVFRRIFAAPACYRAAVPSYVGGDMAFGWGSDAREPLEVPVETLTARFAEAGLETRYYTPEVHKAAFVLPAFIRDLVEAG